MNDPTPPSPTTSGTQPSRQTSQSALAHANRIHGLLVAAGDQGGADRLAAEAERWDATTTNVVVVGDIKRGKSSLVNALVDRPGLLPVDADVATAVHLVLRYGSPESIQVTRTAEDGEQSVSTIEASELIHVASMAGDRASRQGVSAVDVAIDHPLLASGLTIVDTPGVGGMSRGHRDITMAALQRADVLVFVVSVQEPVSRTELEFLAEASERIGNVVVVATRADLATAEANDEMVADTRRRLAALARELADRPATGDDDHAGAARATASRRLARLADRPIVLTSSYLADQARRRAQRGRADTAAELRTRSGIDDLADHLGQATASRQHIRLANLLQLMSSLLAGMEDEQATRLRALGGDGTVEDELRERSDQLERAASQQARWRSSLATSISRLQTGAGREVSRELNLVRDRYRVEIEQHQGEDLTYLADQVQQSLQAAWVNLADGVVRQFDDVIANLLEELEIPAEAGLLGELQQPPGVRAMGRKNADGGQFDMLEDGLPLATQTFMFGNIANAVVGVLGIATGGLGVMAYGVGIALSAPVVMMRRKAREKRRAAAELQRELGEALFGQEGISREFSTELSLRIIDAREKLESLIDERLTTRRKELEARRRELQALVKSERATQATAEKEAERVAGDLATARHETDRLTTLVDQELDALTSGSADRSPADATT